jgi:hypothetical protein
MSEQAPRVIIHKEQRDEIYLRVAEDAAEATGWGSVVCDEVDETVDAMADGDAVVTGLGHPDVSFGAAYFPSSPILARATQLDMPVALLSGHPAAAHHVKRDSQDIYIPTIPYGLIAPRLETWFRQLVQEPATA